VFENRVLRAKCEPKRSNLFENKINLNFIQFPFHTKQMASPLQDQSVAIVWGKY
jgi:hypothetical protein